MFERFLAEIRYARNLDLHLDDTSRRQVEAIIAEAR